MDEIKTVLIESKERNNTDLLRYINILEKKKKKDEVNKLTDEMQ